MKTNDILYKLGINVLSGILTFLLITPIKEAMATESPARNYLLAAFIVIGAIWTLSTAMIFHKNTEVKNHEN